jgi:hypothetical protein
MLGVGYMRVRAELGKLQHSSLNEVMLAKSKEEDLDQAEFDLSL